MASSTMMACLIATYIVIACIAVAEGNVWRAIYWVAASCLTLSVLKMT